MNRTSPFALAHKFESLDALRGIAAIAVLVFHTSDLMGRNFFPHGYLAVDFFFLLSGFVLAFAYQSKLDAGLPSTEFLKLRLIRLFPLYLAGLLLGFTYTLVQGLAQHVPGILSTDLRMLVPGLVFLPQPSLRAGISAFPFNLAAWSLFFELFANVVHALFLRRRSNRILIGIMAFAAALLTRSAFQRGSLNAGEFSNQAGVGLERVLFSYIAGLLLFRLWSARRSRLKLTSALPPALLLVVILAVPFPLRANAAFELIAVFAIFPATVFVAASSRPPAALLLTSQVLGTASYAIYILHLPLLRLFASAWKASTNHFPAAASPYSGIVFIVLVVLVALWMDRYYDLPVRAMLHKKVRSLRSA